MIDDAMWIAYVLGGAWLLGLCILAAPWLA